MHLKVRLCASVALATLLITVSANAMLVQNGDLVYDSDQDITWLRDGMYSRTSGYDSDGRMTWYESSVWANDLSIYDPINDSTYVDWRLPTIDELVYMYENNNINRGSPGPFVSLQPTLNLYYLSSTESNNPTLVRVFSMYYGTNRAVGKGGGARHYSWAVINGDVSGALATVPVPATVWLFGSALGLLGWMQRRVA